MTMTLPGQPGPLLDSAQRHLVSAERIAEAARFLTELALAGQGAAISAITTRAGDSAADLTRAYDRYAGTAHALRTYAVELSDLHREARQLAEAEARAESEANQAAHEVARLELTRAIHEQNQAAPHILQHLEERIRAAARRKDFSEANAVQARQAFQALRDRMNEAAERAIAQINTATGGTNDSFWDHLAAFVEDVGSFFASVGRWARDFLARVLEVVLTAIAVIVVALLALALLVLVAALLAVAIVALAKVILFLLTNPYFWLAVALLVAFVLSRISSDILAPTPEVRRLNPADTDPSKDSWKRGMQLVAAEDLSDPAQPATVEDLLRRAELVDAAGGEHKSVVDIQKVVGVDGVVRYIVTLPSTQDWVALGGDRGATNDLDSNFALMLTPALKTQYERAVYLAMQEAGIGPDDPVLLVGFSQGGIMAGHLAANRSDDFNIQGIVAVGSPIDHLPIPPDVSVVSIQHDWDPVPNFDLRVPGANTGNWQTHPGGESLLLPGDSHKLSNYADTAARLDAETGGALTSPFADFLDPRASHSSEQYQWSE